MTERQYFVMLGVDVKRERTCILEVGSFPSWDDAFAFGLKMHGRTARSAYGQARVKRLGADEHDTTLDRDGHRLIKGFTVEAVEHDVGTTERTDTDFKYPRLSPLHALEQTWKPGERVELCQGGHGGSPRTYRPGTVERINKTYGYHEDLVVKFDDGEIRAINPDVMRHIR